MDAEVSYGKKLMAAFAARWACFRRQPKVFSIGLATGILVTVSAMLGSAIFYNSTLPFEIPPLKLASNTVAAGGYIGSVQPMPPRRHCVQDQTRIMWRWDPEHPTQRQAFLLADVNVSLPVWSGQTTIMIKIPPDVPPGEYHYVRQVQVWCSWINNLFGPMVGRSNEVPFRVTGPVALASTPP